MTQPSANDAALFPHGHPTDPGDLERLFEQYKLLLQTIDSIESRRQTMHTFFMSINSLFLAAIGFLAKDGLDTPSVGWGVLVLGGAGVVLATVWRWQIQSFGQVTKSKWDIVNEMEKRFRAHVFIAEYAALESQDEPFRGFTVIETRVTHIFGALYAIALAIGTLLVLNWI